jgi:hypothetical protein
MTRTMANTHAGCHVLWASDPRLWIADGGAVGMERYRCLGRTTPERHEWTGTVLQCPRIRVLNRLNDPAWWYPEGPLSRSLESRSDPMSGICTSAGARTSFLEENDVTPSVQKLHMKIPRFEALSCNHRASPIAHFWSQNGLQAQSPLQSLLGCSFGCMKTNQWRETILASQGWQNSLFCRVRNWTRKSIANQSACIAAKCGSVTTR